MRSVRRTSRPLLASVFAVVAIALAGHAAPAFADAPVRPSFFGSGARYLSGEVSAERRDAYLERYVQSGFRDVRQAILWHTAEPTAPSGGVHRYNWTAADHKVRLLAREGLQVSALLGYSTSWAAYNPSAPDYYRREPKPQYHDDFAAFAGAVARRYGPGGGFWRANPQLPYRPIVFYEVFNEVNWVAYRPGPDRGTGPDTEPEQYADLFARTADAIHSVQPDARVSTGGMAYDPEGTFLERMFAARPSLRERTDAIGLHVYGANPAAGKLRLATMRHWIDLYGDPRMKIAVTEDGLAAYPDKDYLRRRYLARMAEITARSDCRVSNYYVFTWWTAERDPSNGDDWFGLLNQDGSLKPSGQAFVTHARRLTGQAPNPLSDTPIRLCYG